MGYVRFREAATPIVRIGQLVAAYHQRDGKKSGRCVFAPEQGAKAIGYLDENSEVFHDAIYDALEKHFAADPSTRIHPRGKSGQPKLARAGRNRRLGTVYDFDEIELCHQEFTLRLRACVTVCVSSGSSEVYSKLWVRVRCMAVTTGAVDCLTNEELGRFYALGKQLAELTVDAIETPYLERIVRPLAGSEVVFDKGGLFRAFFVGANPEEFEHLLDKTERGRTLESQISENPEADRLDSLYKVLVTKDMSDVRYLIGRYQDGYRGLCLARFDDDVAEFIGLAYRRPTERRRGEKDEASFESLRTEPCSVVSASFTDEYARFF
jgi:hypothetical protein